MAKARRASDPRRLRLFKTSSQSDLTELHDRGFDKERQMHNLIERNIGILLPGLTFLSREFRDLDGGRHIPDTVAFDKGQNTFVVIEYKNKLDRGVIDQAKAYLKHVKKQMPRLILEYANSEGTVPLDPKLYNQNAYAIIMAPEFSQNQTDSAEGDADLELHEISMYDDHIILVERVGGAHERTVDIASTPSPGAEAARIQDAAHVPGPGDSSPQTEHLYNTIRARLLDEFSGAEEHKKKFYRGFRYPGGKYFCTIAIHKSKIGLFYSGKRAASELKQDDFVRDVNGWGIGKLRSEIKNEDDFEKALVILKRLHDGGVERAGGGHKRQASPHVSNQTPLFSNPPQMISIVEWVRGIREWKKGMRPTHVTFPDQPTTEVTSWTAIHAKAIEWLIDTSKISADEQVATESGRILYTSDEANLRKTAGPRKTKYGWFHSNFWTRTLIADLAKIFEHAGVDMNFKIAIRPKET